jgi:large subunit ribosomal protein L3
LSIGLIGKKSGMSRLFLEDGESVPVTAVSVCGNFIADIKTSERDGYNAFVVSKTTKSNNINKAKSEFYKKINLEPGILAEFRSSEEISEDYEVGKHLTADIFEVGQYVDVTGTSKGKGYAGVIKRHISSSVKFCKKTSIKGVKFSPLTF